MIYKKTITNVIKIILFVSIFFLFKNEVSAQNAISLSITPPIFEIMIKPGKEVKQTYSIENLGGDTVLTPKIVYFVPSDENGNVNLTQTQAPEWVKYSKDSFSLKNNQKVDFNVIVSPPKNTPETDHFLTLIFETNTAIDLLGQNSSFYKTTIGSNILLTISEDGNPKKSADIVLFKAPKIIDSLSNINFELTLQNNGNSFWKPTGKIIVNGTNLDTSLTLAPLNILSGYSRNIPCINGEEIIDCKITKKPLIGIYEANLEFRVDEESEIKLSKITIFAFPFSLIFIIFFIAISFLKLRKYLTR